MVCKNCGAEIEQGNKFCLLCGTRVELDDVLPEVELGGAKQEKTGLLELLSIVMALVCVAVFAGVFVIGEGVLRFVGIGLAVVSLVCAAWAVLRFVSVKKKAKNPEE